MSRIRRSLLDDPDFVAALDRLDEPDACDDWPEGEPQWICESFDARGSSHGRIAVEILAFTAMTALGAAGAAFVFHDRVATLLR